jgi:two-component system sensor histidine kinase/response regulator
MTKKILIIEDELNVREDIQELLELEGYVVHGAPNGFEGVKIAKIEIPDLVVCDIMMPGMDGFQVLAELQKDKTTALIPFMFLTARATLDDLRHGMDLGADDYLTKPFTLTELLTAVQTRLRKEEARILASEDRIEKLRANLAMALPHELRTPLVSILGYSELMMMDSSDEYVRNAAQTINQSGKRLHHLIENYLLYAQLEVLRMSPEKIMILDDVLVDAHFTIEALIQSIAEQYNRMSDLHVNILPASIRVSGENISKVIQEIVDNAFKFSQEGQSVNIETHIDEQQYIINVVDEGDGMAPQEIRVKLVPINNLTVPCVNNRDQVWAWSSPSASSRYMTATSISPANPK